MPFKTIVCFVCYTVQNMLVANKFSTEMIRMCKFPNFYYSKVKMTINMWTFQSYQTKHNLCSSETLKLRPWG